MNKTIKHGGRTYNQRLMELASMYNNVRDCLNCGSPIVDGYICPWCEVDDTTYEFKQRNVEPNTKEDR